MVWWYFNLAYVDLPKALQFPEQDLDPTFIASVFTGVLATFGVQTAKKSGDGTMKMQQQQQAAAGNGVSQSRFRKTDQCCCERELHLLKQLELSRHRSRSLQMTLIKCNAMNIKWATLTVGAIFGFAHIGILGHLLNRPQYPVINFPDGDYSSFKVQSGKNGYSFEYKANDPTVLESTKSLSVDKDKRGLFGPTTDMRRELRSDQYTMDGISNLGGANSRC